MHKIASFFPLWGGHSVKYGANVSLGPCICNAILLFRANLKFCTILLDFVHCGVRGEERKGQKLKKNYYVIYEWFFKEAQILVYSIKAFTNLLNHNFDWIIGSTITNFNLKHFACHLYIFFYSFTQ